MTHSFIRNFKSYTRKKIIFEIFFNEIFKKLPCFEVGRFKNRTQKRLRLSSFGDQNQLHSFSSSPRTHWQMMRTDNYSVADFNWTKCGISARVSFVP